MLLPHFSPKGPPNVVGASVKGVSFFSYPFFFFPQEVYVAFWETPPTNSPISSTPFQFIAFFRCGRGSPLSSVFILPNSVALCARHFLSVVTYEEDYSLPLRFYLSPRLPSEKVPPLRAPFLMPPSSSCRSLFLNFPLSARRCLGSLIDRSVFAFPPVPGFFDP